jgi:hypothetical protein
MKNAGSLFQLLWIVFGGLTFKPSRHSHKDPETVAHSCTILPMSRTRAAI